jgi:hypothetical protein
MTLRVGKLSFELRHARGETDDHVWVHVPERGWIFPGDLFIWAVPNAGNPQKVQRYCEEWGSALREIAALDAGLLVCGHGVPIFGRDRIRQALVETAEYLESIERQTIALMNRGLPLDEILHRVRPPAHLLERPYLQAVYDVPQFLVRNVWRRYGGWWDGEPDSLLPAPRRQQAREWVALAGGVEPLLARVAALEAAGDLRMASHLVEIASLAEPESEPAADARASTSRTSTLPTWFSLRSNVDRPAAFQLGTKPRVVRASVTWTSVASATSCSGPLAPQAPQCCLGQALGGGVAKVAAVCRYRRCRCRSVLCAAQGGQKSRVG